MHPTTPSKIQVQAVKYDGSLHYDWEATWLQETDQYVLVYGQPGRKLKHHTRKQIFICDTPSLEYYDLQEGYTVNLDLEPDGERYYCNICLPAERTASGLRFVDLDLDLIRSTAGEWTVVDEDEFLAHQLTYHYPVDVVQGAERMLHRLQDKIKRQAFPFDGFLESWLVRLPHNSGANRLS
ncbi:DUF402 domain-containing protein [Exiguobacterium artemiae]|uniref:DUF402 domain-containing protein n=1 Tax=Exiguobacterium artemiae TaxID=340145 RepID=UPI003D01D664